MRASVENHVFQEVGDALDVVRFIQGTRIDAQADAEPALGLCVRADEVGQPVGELSLDKPGIDLFIDEEGAPYPSDRIRSVLDKNGIKYSGAISTYEEYRNILYGNSDNKRDYSCFSLMESGSYQNIIRTIQNVLLNSRLEADYIKQTIITSLNEADSVIDLSRYRSHLSGFEAQLNDIGVFREPGMARKAAGISTLSDDIRKRDLRINDLCRQLRGAYLQTERILPELSRKIHEQEAVKSDFYKQRDKLDAESKNRTATMEGELAVLKNALSEAEAKRVFYAGKDIQTAMDRSRPTRK